MLIRVGVEEGGEPELRRENSLHKRMATDTRLFRDLAPGR